MVTVKVRDVDQKWPILARVAGVSLVRFLDFESKFSTKKTPLKEEIVVLA